MRREGGLPTTTSCEGRVAKRRGRAGRRRRTSAQGGKEGCEATRGCGEARSKGGRQRQRRGAANEGGRRPRWVAQGHASSGSLLYFQLPVLGAMSTNVVPGCR